MLQLIHITLSQLEFFSTWEVVLGRITTKSESSFQELLEILLDSGFDQSELNGTRWRDINRRLGSEDVTRVGGKADTDEWRETPVKLSVPLHKRAANPGTHDFEVTALWHRKCLAAIRARLTDPEAFSHFHLEPYQLIWDSSGDSSRSNRVYGEAYTSQVFINTHLTDFGHDKLWPLYMAFGNESKYRRAELSTRAFDHVAYFGSLPPAFKDMLKKELGSQFKFMDGYSADYPEKDHLHLLGTVQDNTQRRSLARIDNHERRAVVEAACDLIYNQMLAVNSKRVEDMLSSQSFVPTMFINAQNTFSKRLGTSSLDIFRALPVYMLHELELGVWKSLLVHLLRILDTQDDKLKDEFDRRTPSQELQSIYLPRIPYLELDRIRDTPSGAQRSLAQKAELRIKPDPVTDDISLQYNVGKTENNNFVLKLRTHLAPRIQAMMKSEAGANRDDDIHMVNHVAGDVAATPLHNYVHIKNDRIYHQKRVWLNYTTYDVRRARDIVNPGTEHCHVMMLDPTVSAHESSPQGRFLYARVLGAYHANVVYNGPGSRDYHPRRVDFLWVRWYKAVRGGGISLEVSELPEVSFHPIHSDFAFGFVDPAAVLRACHIIPLWSAGRCHAEGEYGLSGCARDKDDYKRYLIGCFADRDILMRYQWGMGVGHTYAHAMTPSSPETQMIDDESVDLMESQLEGLSRAEEDGILEQLDDELDIFSDNDSGDEEDELGCNIGTGDDRLDFEEDLDDSYYPGC
ncbi:hypothetical protein C8Q80DRAFT_1117222 [Daedaleopsis nitida]|nr:hypothetical protein C8Q80DRAFT_1117222 [Daedaleopsis nitida]